MLILCKHMTIAINTSAMTLSKMTVQPRLCQLFHERPSDAQTSKGCFGCSLLATTVPRKELLVRTTRWTRSLSTCPTGQYWHLCPSATTTLTWWSPQLLLYIKSTGRLGASVQMNHFHIMSLITSSYCTSVKLILRGLLGLEGIVGIFWRGGGGEWDGRSARPPGLRNHTWVQTLKAGAVFYTILSEC